MKQASWLLQKLRGVLSPGREMQRRYAIFRELLQQDKECLELLTTLEEIGRTRPPVDWARIVALTTALSQASRRLLQALQALQPGRYEALTEAADRLQAALAEALAAPVEEASPPYTVPLREAATLPQLVGGKAHALSRVQVEAGLPVPRGFVITTTAFGLFLEHNRLRGRLNELLAKVEVDDWGSLEALTQEMRGLIQQGEVPAVVAAAVAGQLAEYSRQGVRAPWIVRSSACSEDGELSFAGQYASVPQVSDDHILTAYKEILASKYSPRAISYRLRRGLLDQETPMAALVLEMLEPEVSGVIYTKALQWEPPEAAPLAMYAICGHCAQLVDGTVVPEVLYLTRELEPRLLEPGAGSCLRPSVAPRLAAWGLRLEELFGGPQDIEWCQDKRGDCFILQSRPLRGREDGLEEGDEKVPAAPLDYPILLEGGVTASPGQGSGRVYILERSSALGEVPEGAVLVADTLPPRLVGIIGRLRAVVSERGSPASHFASVAREFGLPVLCGVGAARGRLTAGTAVIVDADRHRVYQGEGQPDGAGVAVSWSAASPLQARLQKLLVLLSPLHLTDPQSPDFTPAHCQSIHDLTRFCHEKGMAEMFALGGQSGRGLGRAKLLATDLPLTIYILELEPCLAPAAGQGKTVTLEQIACPPFQACWQGLTHPDVVWHRGLKYLDWEALDRVSAGIMSLKSAGLASYALLAPEYLHLVLRFGYHFALLDTVCGDWPEANYITFRFKGGGGAYDNRVRRLQFIREVLLWAGFEVQSQGDLLEARLARQPADIILNRLLLWGILQGKCQLLDMALDHEAAVMEMAAAFQETYGTLLV